MKRLIIRTLLSVLISDQVFADCNIINFGPQTQASKIKFIGSSEKESGQVVDFQAIYSTKGRFYRDTENKLQLKTFNDAYGEFFTYIRDTASKECKEKNYQGIVNMDVKHFVDENTYFFSATYNYIN
jgi:uncharacterized protein involved in tolerance to divalent cations